MSTDLGSLNSQASAWSAVHNQLYTDPSYAARHREKTGVQAAVDEIRRLQEISRRKEDLAQSQQAEAWCKVWDQLKEHNPRMSHSSGATSGEQSALREIKRLQGIERAFQEQFADPRGSLLSRLEAAARDERLSSGSLYLEAKRMIEDLFDLIGERP